MFFVLILYALAMAIVALKTSLAVHSTVITAIFVLCLLREGKKEGLEAISVWGWFIATAIGLIIGNLYFYFNFYNGEFTVGRAIQWLLTP